MSVPERWWVVQARSPSVAADDGRITEGLLALGGRAVQDVDGWLVTYIAAEQARRPGEALRTIRDLSGVPDVEIRVSWQEHGDWAELWRRGLKPRRVGRRLVVTPGWCAYDPRPDDIVITLDPGMAFGNAEHGTTRASLRLLETALRADERVLDIGSGSGVLAIAAVRLGAASVRALEADPWAVAQARENLARNGVEECVRLTRQRVDRDQLMRLGGFDGVVANIERGLLEPLLGGLAVAVASQGWLILSGVPADEWRVFRASVEVLGFEQRETDTDEGWTTGLFGRL